MNIIELYNAIHEAIFEFEELIICANEDIDDELHDYISEFEQMAESLRKLSDEIEYTTEYSNPQGLAIMRRSRQLRSILPFYQLLNSIDIACRQGVRGAWPGVE